ncbi:MAG: hypothetical protein M1546_17065 [Chloroflexi bacterium]|nr:hypothetical protein [Chloroflexota bacterium]
MKLPLPWRRAERKQQSSEQTSQRPPQRPTPQVPSSIGLSRVGEAIAQSHAVENGPLNPYIDRWVDIVIGHSNVDLLTGHQNAIIFGTKSAGRQAIMTRVVDLVNARFGTEKRAAVYTELEQMVSASTLYAWTSVDAVYRELIASPLAWSKNKLHLKPDKELQKIETQLNKLLDVPVAKLDTMAVRDAFYAWLDRIGIQTFSLFIDNLTSLAPEFVPILLQMLLDTFPRGGRVSFKLGGMKSALKLEERAKRGPLSGQLGMQFSHDVLVGLDLDQLLRMADAGASPSDPRQIFLLASIQALAPDLAAVVKPQPDPMWAKLFDPEDAWLTLFKASDFEIDIVGAALENLLPALVPTSSGAEPSKADVPKIEQAAHLAKAQAGLSKPDAQTKSAEPAPVPAGEKPAAEQPGTPLKHVEHDDRDDLVDLETS